MSHKMLTKTFFLGKKIVNLTECHSTNDYALQYVKQSTDTEGTIIIAEKQTHGKGQWGNYWQSEPGKNLTFSLILKPSALKTSRHFFLNMTVSCGIVNALNELYPAYDFFIKWPNDIICGKKKIGGILIENNLSTDNQYLETAVCGIGINVNQTNFIYQSASSLANIISEWQDKTTLLEYIIWYIEGWYLKMREQGNDEALMHAYQQNLLNYMQHQQLKCRDGKIINCRLYGVDNNGYLIAESANRFYKFGFKEVTFIGY